MIYCIRVYGDSQVLFLEIVNIRKTAFEAKLYSLAGSRIVAGIAEVHIDILRHMNGRKRWSPMGPESELAHIACCAGDPNERVKRMFEQNAQDMKAFCVARKRSDQHKGPKYRAPSANRQKREVHLRQQMHFPGIAEGTIYHAASPRTFFSIMQG